MSTDTMFKAPGCPSREKLVDFLSGRLAADELETLANHVAHCRTCGASLERVVESDTIARSLKELDPLLEYRDEIQLQVCLSGGSESDDHYPRRVGRYRFVEELGRGGMGVVFKAIDEGLDCVVAVKLLNQQAMHGEAARRRFERERKTIGQLNHANIVRARTGGEEDGYCYLAMDYIDGMSFTRILKRTGPLSIPDAAEACRQTCLGLQYIHEQGVVHRDIKPSNLMVDMAGNVLLLDLGIASLRPDLLEAQSLTGTNDLMGTLDYMSPEQAADPQSADIRADIYSLGCTLFCLLVGVPPFADKHSVLEKLTAHRDDRPPQLQEIIPDIPAELTKVVERALSKSPENRYSSPAQLLDALAPFCDESNLGRLCSKARVGSKLELADGEYETTRALDTHKIKHSPRRPPVAASQNYLKLIGATLLVCFAIGGIYYGSFNHDEPNQPAFVSLPA